MTLLKERRPRAAKLAIGVIILLSMLPAPLARDLAGVGGHVSASAPGRPLRQSIQGSVIRVCASGCATYDYRTIGQAIAAASSGDEIHVAQGAYNECLQITNKSLTLLGGYWRNDWGVRNPEVCRTIIDGKGQCTVVTLVSTTGAHIGTVDGFTIKGGYTTQLSGGIRVSRYQATISNNLIEHNDGVQGAAIALISTTNAAVSDNTLAYNTATAMGGAIRVHSSTVSISDNDIHNNTAVTNGGAINVDGSSVTISDNQIVDNLSQTAGGGGIAFQNGASGDIINNRIESNSATGGGGGVLISLDSQATIRGNQVLGNSSNGLGGGISVDRSQATVENNDVEDNYGLWGGGGMQLTSGSTGRIYNNRFLRNRAGSAGAGGGAIYFYLSSPEFVSNTVVGNTAVIAGGGLHIDISSPQVFSNVIRQNYTDSHGGGVSIVSGSRPKLTGNTIAGNRAGLGGGVYSYNSVPAINQNEIVDNESPRGGGLCFVESAGFSVVNNVIARNSASEQGGGVHIGVNSAGQVVNNTFVGNNLGSRGEAINLRGNATGRIANNILVYHSYGVRARDGASPSVEYNNAWQNTVADYAGVSGGPGHISYDPQFEDTSAGDYHLTEGSQVIDAGTAVGAPNYDFEGDRRPMDGDANGSALWDIGADEYQYSIWVSKDADPLGPDPGDTIAYSITYRNNAGYTASGVVISDILSAELVNPSFTFTGPNITRRSGTTYVWDVENLGPGDGGTITITALVDPNIATPAFIPNTAEFYGAQIGTFSDGAPMIVGALKTLVPLVFKVH